MHNFYAVKLAVDCSDNCNSTVQGAMGLIYSLLNVTSLWDVLFHQSHQLHSVHHSAAFILLCVLFLSPTTAICSKCVMASVWRSWNSYYFKSILNSLCNTFTVSVLTLPLFGLPWNLPTIDSDKEAYFISLKTSCLRFGLDYTFAMQSTATYTTGISVW